jgi:hypothetical protein
VCADATYLFIFRTMANGIAVAINTLSSELAAGGARTDDALRCQMWIVEARSHDDSDTLDNSGFHVVDAVRLRTTIASKPDDRWRNSLNRHCGFALLQPSGIRNRT